MAKGQKRSTREARKPKQSKPKAQAPVRSIFQGSERRGGKVGAGVEPQNVSLRQSGRRRGR